MRKAVSGTNLRFAIWMNNLRLLLLGAAVLSPIIVFLLWWVFLRPAQAHEDVKGRGLQRGIAVVTAVTHGRTGLASAFVEINRRTAQTDSFTPVRVGQEVQVWYRVGKSGMVYVERMEPMTYRGKPSLE